LLAKPSDVAVFWPASGIAAGILVAAGRRAGVALVMGVVIGTIVANLMNDRNLSTSIVKGFCNAGEAVVVAWLLERWCGRPFTFGDLRRVAGLLAAASLATAASAIGGAATMTLFQTTASFWDVWRTWFLSDGIGIVVVAPLVIALGEVWREQPSRSEVIEAAGALTLLTLVSFYVVTHPAGSWLSFTPGAVVLPILLWLTARCPPAFPIAGAFIASIVVICATTFGIGRFGDTSVPIMERVRGAQVAVTMLTIYTLVLIALFAERRRSESELKQSNNRLQLALDSAELGTWSLHLDTGRFENDARDRRIHGHEPEALAQTLAKMRSQVHPDDLSNLDAVFVGLGRSGGSCRTEYRLAPLADQERTGRERWVAMQGTVVRSAGGLPMQLLGVTCDITERKHAEQALAERELQLALAGRAALVGTYAYDIDSEILQVSEGYAAIHGYPEGTTRIARSQWLACVHPDDVEWLERRRCQVFRERQAEYIVEFRITCAGRRVRWIEARSFVSYDSDGHPQRMVGVNIDITDRKQAEQALAERNAQLDLAGQIARIGSFTYDHATQKLQLSLGFATIYGLPKTTLEISREDWRALVHPDDLPQLDAQARRALANGETELVLEFRILRHSEVRWIESRMLISYDGRGKPVRRIGAQIDVTERKRAEQALAERNTQLELASQTARVGSLAIDLSTALVHLSPGCAMILGLPESTFETSRDNARNLVHPHDLAQLDAARDQAFLKKQREFVAQFRILRANDGEVRWIEARSLIFYDQRDQPMRLIAVIIDFTERKRTEALLSESKALLADAMAAGHVMAFDWNAVTGLTQRSDNAADVLGSDQDELTGSPRNIFLSHIHPDDRTNLRKRIRALRPGNPSYALTFRYIRPDGTLVWLEEAGRGEFDATGELLRVKGLTRDITDRKRAEDALAERKAQLALAGRAGRVGSYAYDVEKGLMQISEGYAAIHGLPAGTTETTLCEWRSRVHPDDLRRVEVFRDQMFANRQKEYNIEYRIVRSDGEMRWVERRSSVSYDGDGRPTRVVGVSIDVTERKRAEDRQRILVAELDHRVKNALATVSSVISHTAVGSRSVADFVATIDGRIRSMATTQDLLRSGQWDGISLTELIRYELAPYATRQNTKINGPEVVLRPEAGHAMAMVVHELATNAAKYGALSTKQGSVSIRWEQRLNGHPLRLVLEWQEVGGPPVVDPDKDSFGMSTIRDIIPYEFGGKVDLTFALEGVRCRVELPADWLRTDESFQRPSHTRP